MKNWDVWERGEGVKQLIWMVNQADYEMKWSVRQPESHNARLQQVYSKCLFPLFPFISTQILLRFFGFPKVSQPLSCEHSGTRWIFQLSCNLSRCCVELEEEVISGQLVLMSVVSYLKFLGHFIGCFYHWGKQCLCFCYCHVSFFIHILCNFKVLKIKPHTVSFLTK